jgi:hypothetical protein
MPVCRPIIDNEGKVVHGDGAADGVAEGFHGCDCCGCCCMFEDDPEFGKVGVELNEVSEEAFFGVEDGCASALCVREE